MRKITPVMLVLLLVASLMANIDIAQLETNEVVEDSGARSGADAELVAITSPKETVCEPTCRNELFVGQDTTSKYSFKILVTLQSLNLATKHKFGMLMETETR